MPTSGRVRHTHPYLSGFGQIARVPATSSARPGCAAAPQGVRVRTQMEALPVGGSWHLGRNSRDSKRLFEFLAITGWWHCLCIPIRMVVLAVAVVDGKP